jgi:hypothetical protein
MNSATWFVTRGARRWVAKAVPTTAAALAAALRVATARRLSTGLTDSYLGRGVLTPEEVARG